MASESSGVSRRALAGLGLAAASAVALAGTAGITTARAQTPTGGGTIKVGILHSLSGTMAISETTLKDVMLMLIDQQNKKGGVLGHKLEAVVTDPASNWPLFAEKARGLLSQDKCAAVFGCWTSRVAQIRAAGVRGAERHPVLPGPVRRPGMQPQRVLHRRRAEPAGDPGGRLPDGQGRRQR